MLGGLRGDDRQKSFRELLFVVWHHGGDGSGALSECVFEAANAFQQRGILRGGRDFARPIGYDYSIWHRNFASHR